MGSRCIGTLHKHDLESAFDLRVTRFLKGGNGKLVLQKLLTFQLAATTGLPAFFHKAPATQQILFQNQLDELGGFTGIGLLLKE